jgi:hypothetical protein
MRPLSVGLDKDFLSAVRPVKIRGGIPQPYGQTQTNRRKFSNKVQNKVWLDVFIKKYAVKIYSITVYNNIASDFTSSRRDGVFSLYQEFVMHAKEGY